MGRYRWTGPGADSGNGLLAMSTIGLKSGVLPRWFGRVGYVLGAILLAFVAVWDWVILVLPAWVALISLYILRREGQRRRTA